MDEKYFSAHMAHIPVSDPAYESIVNSGLNFTEQRIAKYTTAERKGSPYLQIQPSYVWSEDLYVAKSRAQFFEKVCRVCLAREGQTKAIRMNSTLGKKYDLFTVPFPEWLLIRGSKAKDVFDDFGCQYLPLCTVGGRPIKDAWQVVTPVAKSPLVLHALHIQCCPLCGTKAYEVPHGDYAPSFASEPGQGPRLTQEWFSHLNEIFRYIYVPNVLAKAIKEAGLKHASFRPQAPATQGSKI